MQVEVNVEDDPTRLLQPTQSFLSERQPVGSAFKPVHGYDVQRIVSDKRFRVAERLHARGISNSAYALDVMNTLHKESAPRRIDSLTTDQRTGSIAPRFG